MSNATGAGVVLAVSLVIVAAVLVVRGYFRSERSKTKGAGVSLR